MCNTYSLRRDFVKTRWKGGQWNPGKLPFSQLEHGGTWIIRPTRPAPVFLQDETCRLMRWGFVRPWAKAINNARVEKTHSPMWQEAFEKRRCLIPMSGWYEFTGPTGNMTAHLLDGATDELLLAAGLWEQSPEWGECYTMLMTESEGVMKEIHTRMPILLSPEDGEQFLAGGADRSVQPSGIAVRSKIVPSPLKKSRSGYVQEDLF